MILKCLLLGFFLVAGAQSNFFPENTETTYDYHSAIESSGSPDDVKSGFEIHAEVVVRVITNNSTHLRLKNIKYTSFSGKLPDWETSIDLPKRAEALKRPFLVVYDPNGLTIGIKTENEDEPWSINIKRAIASILQINIAVLNVKTATVTENTVYGICDTTYTIINDQNAFNVHKKILPNSCGDFKWNSDVTIFDSDSKYEHRPIVSSFRNYVIKKLENFHVIDQIYSNNRIEYTAIGYKGAPIITVIKQYFKKSELKKVEQEMNIAEWPLQSLKTTFTKVNQDGTLKDDLTGGRSVANQDDMLEKAKREVDTLVKNSRSRALRLNGTIKLEEGTIYRAVQVLSLLKYDVINELYKSYSKSDEKIDLERLQVVLNLLPYIGTRCSAMFIRDSVLNNTINTEAIEKILRTFPSYYKNPDLFIVEQMYKMMNASVNREVKVSIILSVASIFGRIVAQYPSNERLKQIEDVFINEFISITDPFMKAVYVSAMSNMRSKSVYLFLEGLITGENKEVNISINTRGLIMWSVRLEHAKHPELMQRIYWPILLNNKEDIIIRTAAFKILTTLPTLDDLLMLKTFYYGDAPPNLRILIKTYINSIMNSKSAFYTRTRKLMTEAFGMEFSKIDKFDGEINYIHDYVFDYIDPNLGFGVKLKGSVMGNLEKDRYLVVYLQISPQFDNYVINADAILFQINIRNVDDDILKKSHIFNMKRDYINSIFNILLNELYDELYEEVLLLKNNRVVGVYKSLNTALEKLTGSWYNRVIYGRNITETQYITELLINADIVVPTDFGVPVHSSIQVSTMDRIHLSRYGRRQDIIFNPMRTTQLFVSSMAYNPLADLWHGSKRIQSLLANCPLDLTTNYGEPPMVLHHTKNGVRKSIGARSLASSYVFVEDAQMMDDKVAKKKLQLSCKDCRTEILISEADPDIKEILLEHTIENLGISLIAQVTGSDDCRSRSRLSKFINMLYDSSHYNDQGFYLSSFLMRLDFLLKYPIFYPMQGSCDFEFYIIPTHDQNVLNFSVDLPQKALNVSINHKLINDGIIVNSWNLKVFHNKSDYARVINAKFNKYNQDVEADRYCVKINAEMAGYELGFYVKLMSGFGDDGACLKNQTIIDLIVNGSIPEILDPIKIKEDVYSKCISQNFPYKCVHNLTSLRSYKFDFSIGDNELKNIFFNRLLEIFPYMLHGVSGGEAEGQLKMSLDISPDDNLNISLTHMNKEEHISLNDSLRWPFKSLSPHVSNFAPLLHHYGMISRCQVNTNGVVGVFGKFQPNTFDNWTRLYFFNCTFYESFVWFVDVKKIGDSNIALRISYDGNELEIQPGENGSFLVDESGVKFMMDNKKRYFKNWYVATTSISLFMHIYRIDMNIIYNGTSIQIETPVGNYYHVLSGECFLQED